MTVSATVAQAKAGEVTQQSFAEEVLVRLGIKPTQSSVSKFVAWEKQEGGHWNNSARYNPLNTTLNLPGAGNTGTQGNIKVYTSWQQGVDATVKTIQMPAYTGIVNALKSGSLFTFETAVNSSPWGTKFSVEKGLEPQAGLFGIVEGKIPEFSSQGSTEKGLEKGLEEGVSLFSWTKLAEFALSAILLIAGAFLVVYGIMVAVRPRESAMSLPRAVPIPV